MQEVVFSVLTINGYMEISAILLDVEMQQLAIHKLVIIIRMNGKTSGHTVKGKINLVSGEHYDDQKII